MKSSTLKGLVATIACVSIGMPFVVPDAKQRMLRINNDGSTTDITQNSGRQNGRRSAETQSEPISVVESDLSTDTYSSSSPDLAGEEITADYYPTLSPTYTPSQIAWNGRQWRVNMPATQHTGMEHSLQRSSNWQRLRFEVRPSDPPMSSNLDKRRSELSGSVYGDPTRLPNGRSLWGGFSIRHAAWDDMEGMLSTYGIVFGQIHMGSKVGGSPALAFRRLHNGRFRITTRGELDNGGSNRYEAPLSFGEVHDIVYNVVLHPTNGSLRVWLDNVEIVNVARVSIGHTLADSYWNVGLYAPKGVASPTAVELANHVYPSQGDLSGRTVQSPAWPRD